MHTSSISGDILFNTSNAHRPYTKQFGSLPIWNASKHTIIQSLALSLLVLHQGSNYSFVSQPARIVDESSFLPFNLHAPVCTFYWPIHRN